MKPLRTLFLSLLMVTLFLGCEKSEDDEIIKDPEAPENPVTPSFCNVSVATDKAAYHPGNEVTFTIDISALPATVKVRYKYLNTVLEEAAVTGSTWKWQTPATDYQGYIAEVYDSNEDSETIYSTIAVDVSSNWTKFPRYGFLSDYSQLEDEKINSVIENLNRHHINGLQFYDWHYKHHMSLPLVGGSPASNWKDIINRDIYFSTVEKYIEATHNHNMKAMFYNLIFGAWDDAEADGVKREWYVYKDNTHSNRDFHPLPSPPFLSNLYLLDPSNPGWQQYLMNENQKVYEYLDFDGFHMDQLGDRGTVYKYDGSRLYLNQAYQPFIEAIWADEPDKYIVMNAVSQFGQQGIAAAPSDFLYTEVWDDYPNYVDLINIIKQNNLYSNNRKNTVLAAYMNYDLADNPGYFNTPAVLMTNAVIFSHGGAHLEIGEHMLGKEYFPNNNLKMKPDLEKSLITYYDFLIAYQNLLRDGGSFNTVSIHSMDGKMVISNNLGKQGAVSVVAKKVGESQVIHFINFKDSKITRWRDNQGEQEVPGLIKDAKLLISVDGIVKNIWAASPDIIGAASRSLNFVQTGNKVAITLPELKYWSMLVLEY